MTAFSHQLTDGGDDVGHGHTHGFSITDVAPEIGDSFGVISAGMGFRFTLAGIPKNAVISNAKVDLNPRLNSTNTVCRARILAEATDDAAKLTNNTEWDTAFAAATTAKVDWNPVPAWTQDSISSTPDISAIVQEIVDRSGWAAGNHIQIFIDDSDERRSDASADRQIDSVESSGTAATLTFDWVSGAAAEFEFVAVTYEHLQVPGRTVVM